ncbi:MAG: S8 family serine peptidase [Anaerolineae bacterium]
MADAYVQGEILIGWRPEIAACETVDIRQLSEKISPEICHLLTNLVPAERRPQELLAQQRKRAEWQAAARSLEALTGLKVKDLLLPYGVARLAVPVGRETAEIARLQAQPWIAYAEPNYKAWAAASSAQERYPNDPRIGDQWNMRRIGAPAAWAVTRGSYSLVVAVLDSGIDLYHPEFSNRLMPGYDYVNGDNTPYDDNGHGTHVAGLIAANADNFIGITGLAPNVRLLPYKVLNQNGEGSYFNIASAIYAATNNAYVQIINLSLGGFFSDWTLQNAINHAIAQGRLVVAAAGNCAQGGPDCQGVNPDYYPAAYPGVLAVGASDHFDNWASYSGYKPYVGLVAPGGTPGDGILSTVPGGYAPSLGTSMATPLVSAAAALVWTMQPGWSAQQVSDFLKNTADKVGPYPYPNGRNDRFGSGRLNVAGAVRWSHPPTLNAADSTLQFLTDNPGQSQTRPLALTNPSEQAVQWQAQVIQGASWLGLSASRGWATYSTPGNLTLHVGPAALTPGVYNGTVRIQQVSPTQAPAFEIAVILRVVAELQRSYLPWTGRDWFNMGWFDPFAPDVPAPTPLNLSNNSAYPVALPFPVPFYGRTYTTVWISDNGLAWFGAGSPAHMEPPNSCLPSAAAPNNAVYVLALDWDPALGGQVYVHQPNLDTYVVTWYQVKRPWNAAPQSFQLVFRRSGEIAAAYQTIEALPPAIIGTENDDGTVAAQIYCNGLGRRPLNGDTILLKAGLPWQ